MLIRQGRAVWHKLDELNEDHRPEVILVKKKGGKGKGGKKGC